MSAPPPFLTDDEIRQIVAPLVQPAAIMRWFRTHGFPNVQQRPNGMPLVSRAYFDQAMGVSAPGQQKGPPRTELDIQGYLAKFPPKKARNSK